MANEVREASKSESARALARLEENLVRMRSARLRLFAVRKSLGLTSSDAEPPLMEAAASQWDGFFPHLGWVADRLDELTKDLNGDIDAVASAFQ